MKAPFSWPKSSLSIRLAGRAAQLTLTSARPLRGAEIVDGARDQLLARPGLAEDQYIGVGGGDLLDLVQHPARARRALPDDLAEVVTELDLLLQVAVFRLQPVLEPLDLGQRLPQLSGALRHALLQLLVGRLQLPLQAAQTQVRRHPREDLVLLERLGDVVHRADGEAPHLFLGVGERGDEDDGDLAGPRIGLEPPRRLIAVQPRHQDVEQDEVGLGVLGLIQGTLTVACDQHGQPLAVQVLEQYGDVRRGIVDHQDGPALLGLRAHHRSSRK